jgi:TRAP-type mannitol/chloroaromatic compound transport system permease small subunit
MRFLVRLVEALLRVAEYAASASILALAVLVVGNVLLRYVFSVSAMALQELQWYLYALGFLLAMGPTLWADGHVRIDIFFARFPPRWRRWISIGGTLLFLVPFALLVLWASYDFVAYSIAIGEASPNPGGLPALYLFKAMIPVSFLLLLLAALGLLGRWLQDKAEEKGRGDLL